MDAGSFLPLDRMRVVAIATNIPGPAAAAQLARYGASVTKLEPATGDPLQAAAPHWYAQLTGGMQIERIDLRCSQARVLAYLARADLLLTTLRPRALRGAGLEWDEIHAAFPRLCHVAIVGEAGPSGDRAGHDLTYQARAGLLSPPAVPRVLLADMFAAERAANAALAALLHRERGGQATRHEVAIAEGAAHLGDAVRHGLTSADGPLGGALPSYSLYRTADGWVALAALEAHFQHRLRDALHLERLERDSLTERFAQHTSAYWDELAQMQDLPIAALPHIAGGT